MIKPGSQLFTTRPAREGSGGYTLTEILVTLGLMMIVGLGIAQMIVGAEKNSSSTVKQAKQNGELRNAMDTLQGSLANADRPPLRIDLDSNSAGVKQPRGNQIIYNRTEDRGTDSSGNKQVSYLVERVYFRCQNNCESGTPDGEVIIQRKSFECDTGCSNSRASAVTQQKLAYPDDPVSGWKDAPSKLLLSNAQIPEGKSLFSYSSKAGVPSVVSSGQLEQYSLVDVNLQRDEDLAGTDFQPALLASTVYFRKIGTSQTSGGTLGC